MNIASNVESSGARPRGTPRSRWHSRMITGNARFETAEDADQRWTDFTVAAGVTLRVQSGAVIRCTGSFTNYGAINVESGAQGGDRTGFDASTLDGAQRAAALGFNTLPAGGGEIGGTADARSGGGGGGGGGAGGGGGNGGNVLSAATPTPTSAGEEGNGHYLSTQVSPPLLKR